MTIDPQKIKDSFAPLDLSQYEQLLEAFAKLSRLFSDSDNAYIPYRFAENLFIKCHQDNVIQDLSRQDNSFDAISLPTKSGIGIKTFVGATNKNLYKDEKVAEFTKLSKTLDGLETEDLVHKVAMLRNARIMSDASAFGIDLDKSFYHCLIRKSGYAFIHEEPYPMLDESKIQPADSHGNPIKKFKKLTDGMPCFISGGEVYKYSPSKSVLYKRFHEEKGINSKHIPISIVDDPYALLTKLTLTASSKQGQVLNALNFQVLSPKDSREYIVLPLAGSRTAESEDPKVELRSGINQWHAEGRPRQFGEAYIPIPKKIHNFKPDFFPKFEENGNITALSFDLKLPNQKVVKAKMCQQGFKALMSDPNTDLATWLYEMIDGSLEIAKERQKDSRPYTYDDLLKVGKDCVMIVKDEGIYELRILPLGGYKKFIENLRNNVQLTLSEFINSLRADDDV